MIAALSTGHKLGLFAVGLAFIVFALVSALVVPRYRPDFPGNRLGAFVVATVVLFIAMLAAVELFAVEEEEPGEAHAAATSEEQGATTGGTTTEGAQAAQELEVTEADFRIELPETTLSPGTYELEVRNEGGTEHDLAVEGPGVDEKTPRIEAGEDAKLEVRLGEGTYRFWCTVPGHAEAGMDVEVTVG